ncbi:MAG: hypothetical protein EZS28_039974 [Streblomastix strix]|uniref:Uncharacterized protein n=1 Tax=Streblomastix strix TaxID=222440 RepID=A0A5J4U2H9_9EUKA|nr:MAG: hypothetical protein EZS28_039974 [Streblomastix strix]
MAYVSNATKQTLQEITDKIGIKHQYGTTAGILRSEIYNYMAKQNITSNRIDVLNQYIDSHHSQLGQQAMQQIGNNQQSSSQSSDQSQKSLDATTMRSIAYDIMSDQLRVQQQMQYMIDNSVGIGDPSLVAITNVNAQIAAGIHNYKDIQPYDNYNALQDQPSQDIGTRVEPLNQKMTRQITLEYGSQKQKEQVYQQDKELQTINEQQELGDDVLLGVPPAPPIIASQPTQQPQQQPSLLQEDAQQQQIEELQSQQMIDMNRAMNYKLGSMDWGLNPINAAQFPQQDISMRISDKTPSYIQMNKVLTKAEKVNQAKIKKNYISDKQLIEQIEVQKELKKKYGKKQKKRKTKST